MRIFQRVVEQTGSDESGGVSHVDHKDGTTSVGNFAHTSVVPFAGVSACAAHDELGLHFHSGTFHVVVVNKAGFSVDVVFNGIEYQTGEVYRATMREVAAMGEVETHECVAGFHASHEHGHVGLSAGVRLHVGIFSPEELFDTVAAEVFHDVDYFATAVVAVAGIAFGVFVGEAGAHGAHHFIAHEVFRSDEFDA